MSTILRRIFYIFGGLIIVAIVSLLVLTYTGVTANLSHFRPAIEASAGSALGRDVEITGDIEARFSYWPELAVSGLKIGNIEGTSQEYFLIADRAYLQLGILQLLQGEINIADVTAEGVTINLENDAKGNANWVFGQTETVSAIMPDATTESPSDNNISFSAIDSVELNDISVIYQDKSVKKSFDFRIDKLTGSAPEAKPVSLAFSGSSDDIPYDLQLQGDPLYMLKNQNNPWAFTFAGSAAGSKFQGKGDRQTGAQKTISFDFSVTDMNIGAMLSKLGIVKGLEASFGTTGIKLMVQGKNLQEIIRRSSIQFSVDNGKLNIPLVAISEQFEIYNLSGDIQATEGKAISMNMSGSINESQVSFVITGSPLDHYLMKQDALPVKIQVNLDEGAKMVLDSHLKLPVALADLQMNFQFSSERIDKLNRITRLDLPEIGPVNLDSALRISKQGIDLSSLKLKVGSSVLDGEMKLTAPKDKPDLVVSLTSDLIQLDDFDIIAQKYSAKKAKSSEATNRHEEPDQKDLSRLRQPLSYEMLNTFNADIRIGANKILSGADKVGAGKLTASLQDGVMKIEPLQLSPAGGDILIKTSYAPSKEDFAFDASIDIQDFDIGILVRRIEPQAKIGGKLTLDAHVKSANAVPGKAMYKANGHFNFLLAPENFASDVIDLWAVNLLAAIMDKTTEKDKSEVNCIVVRLSLDDGRMQEDAVYLDTTKMRVAGDTDIDFKSEKIAAYLVPKAKKPEFFSIAVPVQVKGDFDDFDLDVGAVSMVGSIVSFVTSPVHVPVRRIFAEQEKADGLDACKAAWDKE